jgi:hypothetical protein
MHITAAVSAPWYTNPAWWAVVVAVGLGVANFLYTRSRDKGSRRVAWQGQITGNGMVLLRNLSASNANAVVVRPGWDLKGRMHGPIEFPHIGPASADSFTPRNFPEWGEVQRAPHWEPKMNYLQVDWLDTAGAERTAKLLHRGEGIYR